MSQARSVTAALVLTAVVAGTFEPGEADLVA